MTGEEFEALENLALKKGMSKTAVLRQALRLYQLVDARGSTIRLNSEKVIIVT
jgi:hypothetical protein